MASKRSGTESRGTSTIAACFVSEQATKIALVAAGPVQKILTNIAPERIRTSDLMVRSHVLYPTELPVQGSHILEEQVVFEQALLSEGKAVFLGDEYLYFRSREHWVVFSNDTR